MCEGFSLDDVLALDAASIAEYGFIVVGVDDPDGGDSDHGPWAYTVGLLDAADHPELVIAGVSTETCGPMLSILARSVLAGERYQVGEAIDVGRGVARVGAVNEIQYELSTFNVWHQLRRNGTLRTSELNVVQIVLPSTFFCSAHRQAQPRLDDPDARIDV
jgi:hypothetical protein